MIGSAQAHALTGKLGSNPGLLTGVCRRGTAALLITLPTSP